MAGSYNHVVTPRGKLRDPENLNKMLENGGDVYEAIEEMYGMIWYLAKDALSSAEHTEMTPAMLIGEAQANYQDGLRIAAEERTNDFD